MKISITYIGSIAAMAINLFAQQPPGYLGVSSISKKDSFNICQLYFAPAKNYKQINDDYLYWTALDCSGDTVKTDTLVFTDFNANKLRIRSISFSRKGQIYCSADSFPARDSVKWRLEAGTRDSLLLRDSLLYYRSNDPPYGRKFKWLLKQKYAFCRGDTLKILLDNPPEIERSGMLRQRMEAVNKTFPKKAQASLFLGQKAGFSPLREYTPQPFFDLAGKKLTDCKNGPGIYLLTQQNRYEQQMTPFR